MYEGQKYELSIKGMSEQNVTKVEVPSENMLGGTEENQGKM
jgi:hypothetical protein